MVGFDAFNSRVVYAADPVINANVERAVLVPATKTNGEFGAINAVAPDIIDVRTIPGLEVLNVPIC